uniref:Origin recognition complex subunit 3 n=1 Tax=Leptobrachium leishanense TaxID=445787 RepID=A0A8C5QVI8_9ANUR
MATTSVSKGCFVFKPAAKKKKTSFTAETSQSYKYQTKFCLRYWSGFIHFVDYFNESLKDAEDGKRRFDSCQQLSQKIKSQTEQLQEELNKKLFDNITSFLRKSHIDFQNKKDDWSCRMRSSEIPTAALVLGIKQLLQKLLMQLMGCGTDLELDEDEYSTPSQQKMNCTMASLTGWYQHATKKSSSPKKKRSSSSGHWPSPPVVVIFKDLESFPANVLQQFIVISSRYIHSLPLVLLFGIATSPVVIHRLLSHSVSSLLCIELFQSLSCTEHLSTVVNKLLLSNIFPFKLSGKVLQVLITIFLYHDFSVQNFIKGFQLSVIEHFHSQPLSILCCSRLEVSKHVKNLSNTQCENIRHLPSFMSYVETQTPEAQVELLTSDTYLKEQTQNFLEALHSYHETFTPILRCLHHFTSILPKYPLGKQIRELYCACLEKKVWETEDYDAALALLRMLGKDALIDTIQKCVDVLKQYPGKQLRDALKMLEEFLSLFQNLEGTQVENMEDEDVSPQKSIHKKTDLYQLQKTLLEMKETRRSKKLSKFESLRLKVVDFLDSLVREYLAPPDSQPLHESMYFKGAGSIRKHLNAVPRIAVHTALNNPATYLKSLESDTSSLSSASPDICIAYKLHLECGRLINLYDWLEAFATVVGVAESDRDPSMQVDEMTQYPFISLFYLATSVLEKVHMHKLVQVAKHLGSYSISDTNMETVSRKSCACRFTYLQGSCRDIVFYICIYIYSGTVTVIILSLVKS